MAPTEYRVIAKRVEIKPLPDLRSLVAAGEALNPEVIRAFREATGLEIRDGYGQTETGQLTGNLPGRARPPRLDGRPAARASICRSTTASWCWPTRRTDPTFFVGYLGGTAGAGRPPVAHRRPGRARTTTATCTSRGGPTT